MATSHPPANDPSDGSDRTPPPVDDRNALDASELDVTNLHIQIVREMADPATEGGEPVPRFLWVVAVVMLTWSGWYVGRRGGTFDATTHLEYATGSGTPLATDAAATTAAVDPVAAGKQIFSANCAACHQATGLGIAGAFPPVVGSAWVTGSDQTLVRILLNGLGGPIVVRGATYNGMMPAWKEALSDDDIAHVATYLRQWAPNAAPAVSAATVATLRAATATRTGSWTAAELRTLDPTAPSP